VSAENAILADVEGETPVSGADTVGVCSVGRRGVGWTSGGQGGKGSTRGIEEVKGYSGGGAGISTGESTDEGECVTGGLSQSNDEVRGG